MSGDAIGWAKFPKPRNEPEPERPTLTLTVAPPNAQPPKTIDGL